MTIVDDVVGQAEQCMKNIASALEQYATDGERFVAVDPATRLAWWGNGGWRNGGWRNWGNGGWHNWGNGWHNGWLNW